MIKRSFGSVLLSAGIIGAAAASVSWYEHVILKAGIATGPSLCNINDSFNCDAINASRYAEFLGIPLAAFGVAFYLAIILAALYALTHHTGKVFWGSLTLTGFFSVLLSAYLFYISKVVIGAFCLFCIVMYIANITIFVSSLLGIRSYHIRGWVSSSLDAPWYFLQSLFIGSPSGSRLYSLAALIAVVGVIAGHKNIEALMRGPAVATAKQTTVVKDTSKSDFAAWQLLPNAPIPPAPLDAGAVLTDYTRGPSNAPIQIIEFSDFECAACRSKFAAVELLLAKFPDKVSFTHKNFPLDQECNPAIPRPMHAHSCYTSRFTRCVGEQGQFWEGYNYVFTESLLEQKSTRAQITSAFFSWAKKAGLDLDALAQCITDERSLTKIRKDIELSLALSIESTPTFFLNGKRTDFSQLELIIQQLLAS